MILDESYYFDFLSSEYKKSVAVIGNGNLQKLTSSDIVELNSCKQLRSNYWFKNKERLKNYIHSCFVIVSPARLSTDLIRELRESNTKSYLYFATQGTNPIDYSNLICPEEIWLDTHKAISQIHEQWEPKIGNWPLTGTIMFCIANHYCDDSLLVSGLDFYTNNPGFLLDPIHDLRVDLRYIIESLRENDIDRIKSFSYPMSTILRIYRTMSSTSDSHIIDKCIINIKNCLLI